jgi:hypothetical protein
MALKMETLKYGGLLCMSDLLAQSRMTLHCPSLSLPIFHIVKILDSKFGRQKMLFKHEQMCVDYYYTRKNAQVVTSLQQTCSNCCSNNLSTGCVRTACSQLVDKLSTAC